MRNVLSAELKVSKVNVEIFIMSLSKPIGMDVLGAVGGDSPVQLQEFLKLNVDCWENIFDYLSLVDILAMSKTCKRMRQIGGHYFREQFSTTLGRFGNENLIYINEYPVRNDFWPFISKLVLNRH